MGTNTTNQSTTTIKSLYDQFIDKFGPEVKPREGNNIRVICPICKHKSLSCNTQNGLLYCFHCTYGKGIKFSGPASGFVESEIDFELHLKVTKKILELCSLPKIYEEYLAGRGIYHPEKYGIVAAPPRLGILLKKYFTDNELVNSGYMFKVDNSFGFSKALDLGRILIPFWSGDEIIGLKSRARPYADELDEEARYICPRGSKIRSKLWYKIPLTDEIIITEGELGAIAGCEIGISTIGIPGIAQIANLDLQEELKQLTKDSSRVYIILDSDPNIQEDPVKLNYSLILNNILPNSTVIYLPKEKQDDKMDLDSYLKSNSLEDFNDILADAWTKRAGIKKWLKNKVTSLENERRDKKAS